MNGKKFQPDTSLWLHIFLIALAIFILGVQIGIWLHIFLIALAIFILGVQIGIKHGRELQLEEMSIKYGYDFSD